MAKCIVDLRLLNDPLLVEIYTRLSVEDERLEPEAGLTSNDKLRKTRIRDSMRAVLFELWTRRRVRVVEG